MPATKPPYHPEFRPSEHSTAAIVIVNGYGATTDRGQHQSLRLLRRLPLHRRQDVRVGIQGHAHLAVTYALPADYYLSYEIIPRPGTVTVAEVAHLYPGPHFQMVWERPGTFLVNGALTLHLTYFDGAGLRSVTNVYTVEQEVRVYATVVTD